MAGNSLVILVFLKSAISCASFYLRLSFSVKKKKLILAGDFSQESLMYITKELTYVLIVCNVHYKSDNIFTW